MQSCNNLSLNFFQSFWAHRKHPNLKLLRYEDLKKDLSPVLWDLCQFLGKPLSDEQLSALQKKVTMESMRERKVWGALEIFDNMFRKGAIGDWKNHEIDVALWDKWIGDNLEGTDIELAPDSP